MGWITPRGRAYPSAFHIVLQDAIKYYNNHGTVRVSRNSTDPSLAKPKDVKQVITQIQRLTSIQLLQR
jgi:hypothetical protein